MAATIAPELYRGRSFLQIFHMAAQGHPTEAPEAPADDLLELVPVDAPTGDPSPAQAQLMRKLTDELRGLDADLANQAEKYMEKMHGRWTPGRDGNASAWIDRLITKLKELRQTRHSAPVALEDGMYVLDGEVFKVQHAVHGSGNQYAKRLIPNESGQRAQFVYAPGAIRNLRPEHRMTTEQAKEWGALYGTCVRCGRLLTAEESIERMMGKTCAGKL